MAERAPDLAGWVTNPVDQSILAGSGLGGGQILEWFDESPEIDLLLANMNEAWAFGRPNAADVLPRIADRFAKIASARRSRSPSPSARPTTPMKRAGGSSRTRANASSPPTSRSSRAWSARSGRWLPPRSTGSGATSIQVR